MKISNTKIKDYTACRRLYHYRFDRNLAPRAPALPLKRGSWLHELLEALYTTGEWRDRHKELRRQYDRLFDEEKDMYGDLPNECSRIMKAYEYHWKEEDKNFDVLAAEQVYEVKMPHGHTFSFRVDAVIEDEYGRWLMEHKSHKSIPTSDYRFIDTQSARYVWGLEKLGEFGRITGILWNYLRTKPPTIPKLNQDGTLSKRKIDTDLYTFVSALKSYGLDPHDFRDVILRLKQTNSFFRRERVPKTAKVVKTLVEEAIHVADEIERGYEPIRTISRSCGWCSFFDLCSTELYGGDGDQVVREKYREREKGEYHGDQEEIDEI